MKTPVQTPLTAAELIALTVMCDIAFNEGKVADNQKFPLFVGGVILLQQCSDCFVAACNAVRNRVGDVAPDAVDSKDVRELTDVAFNAIGEWIKADAQ